MGIEFRKMLISIYLKLVVGVFMGSFVSRPVSHTNVLTKVMSYVGMFCFFVAFSNTSPEILFSFAL